MSTARDIERMPHFSTLRRIQIGEGAAGLKLCIVRKYITCAPSEIFAATGVPESLKLILI